MAISFYDVTVGMYRQILPGVCATLDKGKAYFDMHGIDRGNMLDAALAPDMKGLDFQLWSVVFHSLGAIESLKTGRSAPPPAVPNLDWEGWQDLIWSAADVIADFQQDEIEALSSCDVLFSAGSRQRLFTAEEYILSWSLPNLHFHATTAYDILRWKGVPLEKRDYLGRLRGRSPDAEVRA